MREVFPDFVIGVFSGSVFFGIYLVVWSIAISYWQTSGISEKLGQKYQIGFYLIVCLSFAVLCATTFRRPSVLAEAVGILTAEIGLLFWWLFRNRRDYLIRVYVFIEDMKLK
jgi:hypothetical protein